MNKLIVTLIAFLCLVNANAQTNNADVFIFPITNYITAANDSITVVQVEMPNSTFVLEEKQMGLVKHNFSNNKTDTANIGWGRCQLIKGNYYYFGIRLYNKSIKPVASDLLYTKFNYPAKYKGRLYNLVKKAVYFERVTEGKFYDFETPLSLTETNEQSIIDSLVADIKFTGKAMKAQMDEQTIKGGIFDGKQLFETMQVITADNVKDFIDYVIVRPSKYAGHTWKISKLLQPGWLVKHQG
ncbi:MAG: hypothetical protein IPP48_13940 [Chitinophagaceae bacterium]|nr:hypothetical protein [Chitinophagaceae bacterium]